MNTARIHFLFVCLATLVVTACTPRLDYLNRSSAFSAAALQGGGVVVLPTSIRTEALTADEAGQAPVQLLGVLGDRWPAIPVTDLSMGAEEPLIATAAEGFNGGTYPIIADSKALGEQGKGQYVVFSRIDGVSYSRYEGEETEGEKTYTTYHSVCSVSGALSVMDAFTGEVIWEARHTSSVENSKRYQDGGFDVLDAVVTVAKVAADAANETLGYPDPPPVLSGARQLFDDFLLNWQD